MATVLKVCTTILYVNDGKLLFSGAIHACIVLLDFPRDAQALSIIITLTVLDM